MLRSALPFIQPSRPSQPKGPLQPLAVPSAILAHLSGLLDSKNTAAPLRRLAQDIVVEGVVVFFPDATARRDYLLSMIDCVLVSALPTYPPCGSLPVFIPLLRRTTSLSHGGRSLRHFATTSARQTATLCWGCPRKQRRYCDVVLLC